MDLRTERTRHNIKTAFLELRKQKPIEKITVKELAELAYINKATFYTHYKDIYDLADQLETEYIESIIHGIPHPESIITTPSIATTELADVLVSQIELTNALFSGSRQGYLPEKLYTAIVNHINALYPEGKDDLQRNLTLSIIIQGQFHAYQLFANNENREEVTRILGEIGTCLKEHFL